ncbi:hypothetical protein [Alkalihalobacterium alkalinitrilicum]|uniref:hypothetical protein n=1 Tax=Alkalihalobacterium alkalinitrilicum TaxID=427920 RepID=UPI000994C359|nr:hypothetical protein [Alkalihalobacterium alkalinitrilicum]
MKGLTDKEAKSINQTKSSIETRYFQREPGETYFVNEDLKQDWSIHEVAEIQHMWEDHMHIRDIAKAFKCDPDEVFLLLFDLARKSKGELKINIENLVM